MCENEKVELKEYYRAKEIAEIGGFSRINVYVLVKKGLLKPPFKLGKLSLWKREDVEEMFNSMEREAKK